MSKSDSTSNPMREILDSYYRAWFRYHPEAAVDCGVDGYAHLLTPCDEESAGAIVCLNDELLVALEEFEGAALSVDEALDVLLVRSAAGLENERLLNVDPQRVDPMRWLPIDAIYQLTIRPVADFANALMSRLTAIPAHLEAARDHLIPRAARIPRLWLDTTVASARDGIAFLRSLPQSPKVRDAGIDGPSLGSAIEKAVRAIGGYADFLEKNLAEQASGEIACGAVYFEHLLRARHHLGASIDDLYRFGDQLAERTRAELRVVSRELTGNDDPNGVLARLRADHPARDELLEAYRQAMQAARDFVRDRDLVTLPAHEQLAVVETPVFLRNQIPFAAYCDPVPGDPDQQGYYYVTPPASDDELAEHDRIGLRHTCAHEAWPGHHLQFVTANANAAARTLPRLLNASATLYEGWALYSEQLMQEEGFLDRPENRFVLLRDRLWRALRVLIDIDIHCRGVPVDEAAKRLVKELGFAESQARGELTWYSRAPTVPLGYATGWAMINAARQQWRAEHPAAPLREFHDRLLSAGSISLPLVLRRVFGEAFEASVTKAVLDR
ncbi:MAG: DUF885 domain-containing protein [Pseudomonadota bacterium]